MRVMPETAPRVIEAVRLAVEWLEVTTDERAVPA
jgi:hypothetical protein